MERRKQSGSHLPEFCFYTLHDLFLLSREIKSNREEAFSRAFALRDVIDCAIQIDCFDYSDCSFWLSDTQKENHSTMFAKMPCLPYECFRTLRYKRDC